MRVPSLPRAALLTAVAAVISVATSSAAIVQYQITSDVADGEVRQSSAGAYTVNQGQTQGDPPFAPGLRVGFQSSFGSDGQPAGGLDAIWFFKLPKLNLGAGDFIESVEFVTTLLEETATSPITPRFNADLYALGFVTTPTLVADGTFFFAGQNQSGPGLGAGQTIEKVDDDYFTIFADWQAVNSNGGIKRPMPIFADAVGNLNLANYIQGIYNNPAFPNTGNEYLVLRLNPDRAANETYVENGTQPYGKGTTRYRVASGEAGSLVSTSTVDYSDVVPTRLTLNVSQQIPEPATLGLLGLGGLWLGVSRRRVKQAL